jgi:hypothetical protein
MNYNHQTELLSYQIKQIINIIFMIDNYYLYIQNIM